MNKLLASRLKKLENKGKKISPVPDVAFIGALENESDHEAIQCYLASSLNYPANPEYYIIVRRNDKDDFTTTRYDLQFSQISASKPCNQSTLPDNLAELYKFALERTVSRKERMARAHPFHDSVCHS